MDEMTASNLTGVAPGPRPAWVPWTPVDALKGVVGALILFAAVSFLVIGPVALISGEDSNATLFTETSAIILWDALAVLLIYRLVRRAGGTWQDLGLRMPYGVWRTLSTVFGGFFVCSLLFYTYQVVVHLAGLDFLKPEEQIPDRILNKDWLLPVLGVSVVIAAPIAEEILFRGFVYGALRRSLPWWPAALLSSFVFALAHLQVGLVVPIVIIGVTLAFIYERSRSLPLSMGVHFVFNLVSYIVLVVDATSS